MTSGRGRKQKAINLALQGGGSHGAFTWGVLDRLLDDERLDLEAISGTSAGVTCNACCKRPTKTLCWSSNSATASDAPVVADS